MCEITKSNFKEKFPEFKRSVEKSKLISLDLEFSALQPLQTPRLFDSNKERYAKLRRNLLQVIPLQVGITAFHFDDKAEKYFGDVFTFFVAPAAFGDLDKAYYFQASTTSFLCLHGFDFNKFAYLGIPYLNNKEIQLVREKLRKNEFAGETCHLRADFEDIVRIYVPIVSRWYNNCAVGQYLEVPEIRDYKNYYELTYFIHKQLRKRFKNVWTYEEDGDFYVKRVTDEELAQLTKECRLDDDLLDNLTGFKHVFDLLTSLKKPIIGHNILQDLMILVNNFETSLPESYSQFKSLTHQLFPTIFDTKHIYYELRSTIPKEKLPNSTSLETLFRYFKDGLGRHLVLNATAIESNFDQTKFYSFHEAGWDSFCTGYIFLRMAYYKISSHYPTCKKFVSSEILGGISSLKNRVNVIRGAASYIMIDGEDPTSNRPPWLIVESLRNEPLDVSDLVSTLSSFGFVDIKKLSPRGNRVLVAIDTYRAARDISRIFQASPKFNVKQYNALRHSHLAQTLLLSAATISGTLLVWLAYRVSKR